MSQAPDTDQAETSITAALDVESILAIHRDHSGYIGFVRKPDPSAPPRMGKHGKPYTWDNLFSIRAGDLRLMFPSLSKWLTHDSYFTVNAYYRAAPFKNTETDLPDVWRKEKHLQSLTACYADIDCGRPESDEPGAALDWRQAQHEAEALADAGIIPHPSIMARSGRGVYLFWLLRDDKDPDKLPRAWPEKVELYKTCNRALNERLRENRLPADKVAIDAARVLRVPGSIHRKAIQRVRYVIQLNDQGKGFTYTLHELAAALNIKALDGALPDETRLLARPVQYRRVKNKGSAPLRANGKLKVNALRAQDLLTLQAYRGGFLKHGMKYADGSTSPGRRSMLTFYANWLKGSGSDPAAALEALRSMAANMIPPYPDPYPDPNPSIEAILEAEYSTAKLRRISNAKLCPVLGITADLARELDLKTIRPLDVEHEADQALPLQSDMIQARQDFARQYIEEHGSLTARRLANLYKAAGYKGANHETANQDLNALGFVVRLPGRPQRRKAGRPRKAL
jgi:hypothetical protein